MVQNASTMPRALATPAARSPGRVERLTPYQIDRIADPVLHDRHAVRREEPDTRVSPLTPPALGSRPPLWGQVLKYQVRPFIALLTVV